MLIRKLLGRTHQVTRKVKLLVSCGILCCLEGQALLYGMVPFKETARVLGDEESVESDPSTPITFSENSKRRQCLKLVESQRTQTSDTSTRSANRRKCCMVNSGQAVCMGCLAIIGRCMESLTEGLK